VTDEQPLAPGGPPRQAWPGIRLLPGLPARALPLLIGAFQVALASTAVGQVASTACRPYPDSGTSGWDAHRVLRIIGEAVVERRSAYSDSTLSAFDAYAEGHVDFLADFGEFGGEQTVRTDRIALQLEWARGRGSLQTIVGRRNVTWAPTRIHYHIDHLSLVMENFGPKIQVGEGDEVRDVLHPIAEGATDYYQYRLVDSMAVMVGPHTSQVYRIEVRPACQDDPGVIGTLDLDYASMAIARLAVSFTPSAYVDPTVSSISLELTNGWVDRRWWLPVRQRVEVRRQIRWMDLPFSTTIRANFEILDYDLDPDPHYRLRGGHRVAALPQKELARYAGWRRQEVRITDEFAPEDSARFAQLRSQAISIAAGRYLGGADRVRFFLPDLSAGLRYRRAEGLLLGGGASWQIGGRTALYGWAGYPFSRERPEAALELRQAVGETTLRLYGYVNRLTDIGPFPAAAGVISTFGAAFWGDDYTDPYFRDGVALSASTPIGPWTGTAAIVWEEQESASDLAGPIGSGEPRPVQPIDEGANPHLDLEVTRRFGSALAALWSVTFRSQLAAGGDFGYTRWVGSVEATPPDPDAVWQWEASGGVAFATGTLPEQRLILLGGRSTVPGYGFRPWGGDQGAYTLAAVSRNVAAPWLRVRVLAAVGWSRITDVSGEAAASFGVTGSDGLRPSAGAGVSLLWDLVRMDVVRGLDDGEWEYLVSVNPAWRSPL
jgi:hypothetical protein